MGRSFSLKSFLIRAGKCLLAFYIVYFIVTSICFGAFKLQQFDGRMPFDFKRWVDLKDCCISYNNREIANLISMGVTYFIATWAFVYFMQKWIWHITFIVTIFHVGLSCLVMLSFPFNWSYWICLATSVLLMLIIGEMACYYLYRARLEKVDVHVPEPPPEGTVTT